MWLLHHRCGWFYGYNLQAGNDFKVKHAVSAYKTTGSPGAGCDVTTTNVSGVPYTFNSGAATILEPGGCSGKTCDVGTPQSTSTCIWDPLPSDLIPGGFNTGDQASTVDPTADTTSFTSGYCKDGQYCGDVETNKASAGTGFVWGRNHNCRWPLVYNMAASNVNPSSDDACCSVSQHAQTS